MQRTQSLCFWWSLGCFKNHLHLLIVSLILFVLKEFLLPEIKNTVHVKFQYNEKYILAHY